MKEQDAAHSFETWLEYGKLVMALSIDGAMLKVDDVSRHVFDNISEKYTVIQTAELTRLRSELQQKDEELDAYKARLKKHLEYGYASTRISYEEIIELIDQL